MKALQHASSLVGSQPELAVITFAIGIELGLKARLAFEHWRLVLDTEKGRPSESWELLRSGKSRTVGSARLQTLLLQVLPKEEAAAFEHCNRAFSSLAELRNKAAHFGIQTGDAEHDPATLAAAQLRAWHSFRLLSQSWPQGLSAEADWQEIEDVLKQLDKFLETKASELEPHLKSIHEAGGAVGFCPECTYTGLTREITGDKDSVAFGPSRCRICQSEHYVARGPCPQCGKSLLAPLVGGDEQFELDCISCDLSDNAKRFGKVSLTMGISDPRDDPCGPQDPHCGFCETGEHVTRLTVDGREWLFCPSCDEHWPDGIADVEECGYCGDSWVGVDLELSSLTGCPLCSDTVRDRADRQ